MLLRPPHLPLLQPPLTSPYCTEAHPTQSASDTRDSPPAPPPAARRWFIQRSTHGRWNTCLHGRMTCRAAEPVPRRVRLVRGEGRGVSDLYGVRDAACPLSTRGGGGGGGGGVASAAARGLGVACTPRRSRPSPRPPRPRGGGATAAVASESRQMVQSCRRAARSPSRFPGAEMGRNRRGWRAHVAHGASQDARTRSPFPQHAPGRRQ